MIFGWREMWFRRNTLANRQTLVSEKVGLRDKLRAIETNRENRFEPAIAFFLEAKYGAKLLVEGNAEQKRDFLKKFGSNFQVADKTLSVTFKNPWQFVAEWNSSRASARLFIKEWGHAAENQQTCPL